MRSAVGTPKAAKKLKQNAPKEEELYDLADLFKAFADSSRIKILWALSASEFCVCDLADALGMTQSAVSHQLRLLKQSRLIKKPPRRAKHYLFFSGRAC